MNPAALKYGQILHYVYALAAIAIIASITFMIAFYFSEKTEQTARDRVAHYYFTSSAVTGQLYKETLSLSRITADNSSVLELMGPGISGTLFSMQTQINRLQALQDRYRGVEFGATLERLTSRFSTLDRLLAESQPTEAALKSIAAFELNVEQLERLHLIAASDQLARLGETASEDLANVAIFAAILVVALMLGWFVVRLLRKSLAQQTQTEQLLTTSQERMHHMQKLEALGQLVGGVAHDFNNLLTAILGQTQLLKDEAQGDQSMQQGLNEISRAGQQAASLTKQLLTFSRRQPIDLRPVDVNELIRGMEPILRRLIGEDIELFFHYGDFSNAVELDTGQMHQVILNLFINARDAMPNGGEISLKTEQVRIGSGDATHRGIASGFYTKLSVADIGIGMNKETLDRAFEPFFTTKPRGRGTGLGLATVHGIVAAAKGYVFADSTPGEGTSFEIYWPSSERRTERFTTDPVRRRTGSETILVVEDEEQIRKLLRDGLGALGYRMLTVSGGKEGLEICRRQPGGIDVILSDVVMPDMNGADFMEAALPMQPGAVGIFMSGYTDDILLQRGVDGSKIPLIYKPFELRALAKLIREQLKHKPTEKNRRLQTIN